MSGEYRVRWFRDGDLDAYVAGLNENLYDCYDEARFRWKMVDTPFRLGFVPIAVVEHGGKPVAFNSFLPLRVRVGGESFPIVQGCDGFVAPEHRRMGLFQETLRFMFSQLAGRGPEMLMGFNFAGSAGAAQKVGSTVTCDVHALSVKAEDLAKTSVEGSDEVEVKPIGIEEAHRLYEDWSSATRLLHYDKPLAYFRWRFSHPIRRSSFYRVRDGDATGYVAASLERDEGDAYNLFLEDYTPLFERPRVASAVIGHLLGLGERLNEFYMTATVRSPVNASARALGFAPDHVYTLIMRNISGLEERERRLFRKGVELTRVEDWHIASSDVF
ncbi:MAG: GNAT family N-acetyltransferase [Candidatus Bathyarchaeota archaeon]|nr:GNAT family N-acetyltransferase [Candidatus Bathyarchaeota archaeon]